VSTARHAAAGVRGRNIEHELIPCALSGREPERRHWPLSVQIIEFGDHLIGSERRDGRSKKPPFPAALLFAFPKEIAQSSIGQPQCPPSKYGDVDGKEHM